MFDPSQKRFTLVLYISHLDDGEITPKVRAVEEKDGWVGVWGGGWGLVANKFFLENMALGM